MRFILIAAVAVFAAGCAQPVWVKPGASQSDFATDRYTCMQDSQQRVGGAVVNQFGGSATNTVVTNGNLFRSCMNAKGWYLTQPSTQQQSPNAGPLPSSGPAAPNPLAEVDREASRQAEASCADPALQVLWAKSPCKVSGITLEHLADTTYATEPQRAALLLSRQKYNERVATAARAYRSMGGARGAAFAQLLEDNAARLEKASLAVYSGKMTWGELNQARKDAAKQFREEQAKLVAAR
ncbi:hypothetical protein [Variovorax sp. RA8]|uniref:hypothetical protein n=1 Tax=Variovorax sp. (strain JCM 16519 / RA8) TaxID=662548 RepID=UPI0013165A39|nr:hypothetical protein [Variovorax sp. RA8]VTU44012.1 hypothetical protein RA8P2_00022 [Variovorax sp. RA8]